MYRWKGKIATKKQYEKRLAQQKNGYKRKNNPVEENIENAEESVPEVPEIMHGPRIVELKFLGEQLWCISCKEVLSLQFLETEIYQGLASELIIRCHKCLLLNKVITSKTHIPESGNRCNLRYDINSKCVLGALHSGLGWSQLNKLFACMNIPCFNFITFKKYEKEIGLAAEVVAKRSCKNAVALERQRSIDEVVTTEKLL